MKGCIYCTHCIGVRDNNNLPVTGCTLMPSNDPTGCGYMKIERIDLGKERMWFCPLKEPEVTNKI